MNPSIEVAARNIIASMKRAYGAPYTRVPAQEADFPHLDMAAYARVRAGLEAAGYDYLFDYAIKEINDSPTSLRRPTMLRAFGARAGGGSAAYYQSRPHWPRLWGKLLTGLSNGRWIDTPKMILRMVPTRHCIDLMSEFADGSWVSTSNAEAAESIGMPKSLDRKFHPYDTPLAVLLADHRERVAAAVAARGGALPLPVRSKDDVLAASERENVIKREHRAAIGWVTHGELVKMSKGNTELAGHIFAEVRKQLREGA